MRFRVPVRAVVVGLAALLASPAAAPADDLLARVDVPLKKPRSRDSVLKGGSRDKVWVQVWIPDGVRVVRGLMCNPFSQDEPPDAHWRAACRAWGFGYVSINLDAVGRDDYDSLTKGLAELAKTTGHEELNHAPFCFLGMSRGGGMSVTLAEMHPARTIAAVPVCLPKAPATDEARRIPMLAIVGERDGSQLAGLTEKLPNLREKNIPYGGAVQWGRAHEFGQANNLSFVFLGDVIAKRVGEPPEPGKPYELKPFPAEDGWLAGPVAWVKNQKDRPAPPAAPFAKFEGDTGKAVWLPTGRFAAVWQAFVAADRKVKVAEPAGLGDKQPFVLHPVGRPVKVRFAVDAAKSVELWDADVKLASKDAGPWEFDAELKPGIHSLYAKVIDADGVRYSRPHTIVVGEAPPEPAKPPAAP